MPRKNIKIKPAHTETEFTPEQIIELRKCKEDPIYFIRNYVKIKHPRRGQIPFKLYDYQERLIRAFQEHKYNIVLSARQTGKSITVSAYLLWFACFHFDKKILIASNKNKGAMEMIKRIKYAYEFLPMWLKPGASDEEWNKHSISFDNGSQIDSTATSDDSGRGEAISLLYLDEFAFVRPTIQTEFWASILPTLSTGGDCIITSTPNGDSDLFAMLWRSAEVGKGVDLTEWEDDSKKEDEEPLEIDEVSFYPSYVPWDAPPDRDEQFRRKIIAKLGEIKWKQEYECQFLTSDSLLMDAIFLESMLRNKTNPLETRNGVVFWELPKSNNTYIITIDPATGTGLDFSVIEVFHFPSLKQVAEFRKNTMNSNEVYAIFKWLTKLYESLMCELYFTVENNGVGEGIIALYQNEDHPPQAAFISEEGKDRLGMRTGEKTKMVACLEMKQLIEKKHMHINSTVLIKELKTFTRRGSGYSAQRGSTDDCISAVLLTTRVLKEMALYDQNAFDTLYTFNEDEYLEKEEGDEIDETDEPLPMLV